MHARHHTHLHFIIKIHISCFLEFSEIYVRYFVINDSKIFCSIIHFYNFLVSLLLYVKVHVLGIFCIILYVFRKSMSRKFFHYRRKIQKKKEICCRQNFSSHSFLSLFCWAAFCIMYMVKNHWLLLVDGRFRSFYIEYKLKFFSIIHSTSKHYKHNIHPRNIGYDKFIFHSVDKFVKWSEYYFHLNLCKRVLYWWQNWYIIIFIFFIHYYCHQVYEWTLYVFFTSSTFFC